MSEISSLCCVCPNLISLLPSLGLLYLARFDFGSRGPDGDGVATGGHALPTHGADGDLVARLVPLLQDFFGAVIVRWRLGFGGHCFRLPMVVGRGDWFLSLVLGNLRERREGRMKGRKGRTGRGGLAKKDVPQRGQEEGGGRKKATLLGWKLWARGNCVF